MIKKVISISLLLLIVISLSTKASNKYIGLQLWSVREEMKKDASGTIHEISKIGYQFVETAGYKDGKLYDMEPSEFKKLVESNGMKIISAHAGMPAPDASGWDSTMLWWDRCIQAHKELGVKYLIQPYMTSDAFSSIARLDQYCKYFDAVGKKCHEQGIQFGFHNHDKEYLSINDTIIYDYMLQHTNPEWVIYQLDLFWIHKGGKSALDYFQKYPGRFKMFHVKDVAELGGKESIMDFESIYKKAELAGLKYSIVEIEKYNFTPLESARISFEYLINKNFIQ